MTKFVACPVCSVAVALSQATPGDHFALSAARRLILVLGHVSVM